VSGDILPHRGHALTEAASQSIAALAVAEDPRREIRLGAGVALAFFVGFLGWASFARLDAAAYATGQLTVTGERQAVQHRDGGVVGAILVRDGQHVRQGQVVVRLAAENVVAEERALSGRFIGLLAQRARLRTEQLGLARIDPPAEFADLVGPNRQLADEAMAIQRAQFAARASLLSAQRGVIGQQSAQARQQGEGNRRMMVSTDEQKRLISEELEALRPVAAKGFVSVSRIRALERARADLDGRGGQYQATMLQSRQAEIGSRLQAVEADRTQLERGAGDLRDVEAALADVGPKLRAARDLLSRTEIRAPVDGEVVGLSIFTQGGVIAAGQRLMDIVPERRPLVVEARFSPSDADDLAVGQEAQVRFATLHDRSLPILKGKLLTVSADSLTDEKSGLHYFRAEVMVPYERLREIERSHERAVALRPGIPVEVLIPLRKRTALQYLLEPLQGAFWTSFREH